MNYIANFYRYNSDGSTGRFNIVASSDNIDEVLEKCKAAIMLQRERSFEGVERICLHAVIEIKQFPENPLILPHEFVAPDGSNVGTYPLDDKKSYVSVWTPKDDDDETLESRGRVEPFIDFTK
jgi:hypothetical protein